MVLVVWGVMEVLDFNSGADSDRWRAIRTLQQVSAIRSIHGDRESQFVAHADVDNKNARL